MKNPILLISLLFCQLIIGEGFVSGTLVKTSNRSVPIEHLKENDIVVSFDFKTQQLIEGKITKVSKKRVNKFVEIIVNAQRLVVASDHKFFCPFEKNHWVNAQDLKPNHFILKNIKELVRINKITKFDQEVDVYNLTVDNHHNFFISYEDIFVHNWDGPIRQRNHQIDAGQLFLEVGTATVIEGFIGVFIPGALAAYTVGRIGYEAYKTFQEKEKEDKKKDNDNNEGSKLPATDEYNDGLDDYDENGINRRYANDPNWPPKPPKKPDDNKARIDAIKKANKAQATARTGKKIVDKIKTQKNQPINNKPNTASNIKNNPQKPVHPHGKYVNAPYHTKIGNNIKSRAPKNGQQALDKSIKYNENCRLSVCDDEFVVLNRTSDGVYHGHVRDWKGLEQLHRNALTRAGLVRNNGKIIK